MQEEQYYTGSDLKFKINLTASGFDQTSDEYKIEVSCGSKTVTLYVKDNGTWKQGTVYVKQNGSWIEASDVLVKNGGSWR